MSLNLPPKNITLDNVDQIPSESTNHVPGAQREFIKKLGLQNLTDTRVEALTGDQAAIKYPAFKQILTDHLSNENAQSLRVLVFQAIGSDGKWPYPESGDSFPLFFIRTNEGNKITSIGISSHYPRDQYFDIVSRSGDYQVVEKDFVIAGHSTDNLIFKIPWKQEWGHGLPQPNDTTGFDTLYNKIQAQSQTQDNNPTTANTATTSAPAQQPTQVGDRNKITVRVMLGIGMESLEFKVNLSDNVDIIQQAIQDKLGTNVKFHMSYNTKEIKPPITFKELGIQDYHIIFTHCAPIQIHCTLEDKKYDITINPYDSVLDLIDVIKQQTNCTNCEIEYNGKKLETANCAKNLIQAGIVDGTKFTVKRSQSVETTAQANIQAPITPVPNSSTRPPDVVMGQGLTSSQLLKSLTTNTQKVSTVDLLATTTITNPNVAPQTLQPPIQRPPRIKRPGTLPQSGLLTKTIDYHSPGVMGSPKGKIIIGPNVKSPTTAQPTYTTAGKPITTTTYNRAPVIPFAIPNIYLNNNSAKTQIQQTYTTTTPITTTTYTTIKQPGMLPQSGLLTKTIDYRAPGVMRSPNSQTIIGPNIKSPTTAQPTYTTAVQPIIKTTYNRAPVIPFATTNIYPNNNPAKTQIQKTYTTTIPTIKRPGMLGMLPQSGLLTKTIDYRAPGVMRSPNSQIIIKPNIKSPTAVTPTYTTAGKPITTTIRGPVNTYTYTTTGQPTYTTAGKPITTTIRGPVIPFATPNIYPNNNPAKTQIPQTYTTTIPTIKYSNTAYQPIQNTITSEQNNSIKALTQLLNVDNLVKRETEGYGDSNIITDNLQTDDNNDIFSSTTINNQYNMNANETQQDNDVTIKNETAEIQPTTVYSSGNGYSNINTYSGDDLDFLMGLESSTNDQYSYNTVPHNISNEQAAQTLATQKLKCVSEDHGQNPDKLKNMTLMADHDTIDKKLTDPDSGLDWLPVQAQPGQQYVAQLQGGDNLWMTSDQPIYFIKDTKRKNIVGDVTTLLSLGNVKMDYSSKQQPAGILCTP